MENSVEKKTEESTDPYLQGLLSPSFTKGIIIRLKKN